jgi:hypothetical protein
MAAMAMPCGVLPATCIAFGASVIIGSGVGGYRQHAPESSAPETKKIHDSQVRGFSSVIFPYFFLAGAAGFGNAAVTCALIASIGSVSDLSSINGEA